MRMMHAWCHEVERLGSPRTERERELWQIIVNLHRRCHEHLGLGKDVPDSKIQALHDNLP